MKQELETLLIPTIFLLAMIVIIYKMYREYTKRNSSLAHNVLQL